MMNKIAEWVIVGIAAILLGMLIAYPIQFLWNHALVGAIEGVNKIGYWQAYGIVLLIKIMINTTNISDSFSKQNK
jgi:hypothetical protein